jgi:hypothetical protein
MVVQSSAGYILILDNINVAMIFGQAKYGVRKAVLGNPLQLKGDILQLQANTPQLQGNPLQLQGNSQL